MSASRIARAKRLAENPDFIPDIYNYCDRWCERCAFTARCKSYALRREGSLGEETPDLDSEAFWEQLQGILQDSIDLLHEMAEENGIDLDAIDTDAIMAEREHLASLIDNHPLTKAAEAYVKLAHDWFETSEPAFRDKGEELEMFVRLNISSVNVEGEVARIQEAVEVIQWYHFFIAGEIVGALHGRLETFGAASDESPSFSDGKAKITLIAMDRSLAAWGVLLRALPQRLTETLEILAHLERLRQDTERFFPEARAFVRPGFDTTEEEEEELDLE